MKELKEIIAVAAKHGGAAGAFAIILIVVGVAVFRSIPVADAAADDVSNAVRVASAVVIVLGFIRLTWLTYRAPGLTPPRRPR